LHAIMGEAGKPGDRWAGLRKKASREESPDTVVLGGSARDQRATRLVTPGVQLIVQCAKARRGFWLRIVPQKINRRVQAPRWPAEGKPSAGLRAVRESGLQKAKVPGKGETVG